MKLSLRLSDWSLSMALHSRRNRIRNANRFGDPPGYRVKHRLGTVGV